ncbi:MAG: hypothetical protein JNJ44_03445 [Zoogloeaceae bacterium]|nr:hypothetical protein [Zoogloeaceae bacterium]
MAFYRIDLRMMAGLVLAGGVMLSTGAQAAPRTISCCDDAGGRRICGDILPPACYGREYREIGPQGLVLRVVPAPMTEAERQTKAAEAEAQKMAEEHAKENRRRDAALLATYANIKDLETQRADAIAGAERNLKAAQEAEATLLKRRAKLDEEAKAAGANRPPALVRAYRESDSELSAQRSVVMAKQRDLEAVTVRFDTDRQRYLELGRARQAR